PRGSVRVEGCYSESVLGADEDALLLVLFLADDGIRDRNVTGVQTCALPISARPAPWPHGPDRGTMGAWLIRRRPSPPPRSSTPSPPAGARTVRPSPSASPPATSRPVSSSSTASVPPPRRRTITRTSR